MRLRVREFRTSNRSARQLLTEVGVSTLCFSALMLLVAPSGPAVAERLVPRPVTVPAPAGAISVGAASGAAQFGVPLTVSATATLHPVAALTRSRASLTLSASGRTCVTESELRTGPATLTVKCPLTPGPGDLPSIRTTTVVRLNAVSLTGQTAGVNYASSKSVPRVIPVADGPTMTTSAARAAWTTLRNQINAAGAATGAAAAPRPVIAESVGSSRLAQSAKPVRPTADSMSASNAASAVYAEAQISGWSSAPTQARINTLRGLRNPDGGYGLNAAWDAYGDGTTNAANTSYTVTTAGHVGWVLIEAVKHGGVMRDDLDLAIDSLLGTPWLNASCLAYSTSADDAKAPCVYNVNLSAASFLLQARQFTSHRAGEADAAIAAIRRGIRTGYDPATGYWSYMAGSAPQDISHQMFTVRTAQVLEPGVDWLGAMMTRPWWGQPNGMSQNAVALSTAMIDAARDCRFARAPAVLLGARRALDAGLSPSTLLGTRIYLDEVLANCFAS